MPKEQQHSLPLLCVNTASSSGGKRTFGIEVAAPLYSEYDCSPFFSFKGVTSTEKQNDGIRNSFVETRDAYTRIGYLPELDDEHNPADATDDDSVGEGTMS